MKKRIIYSLICILSSIHFGVSANENKNQPDSVARISKVIRRTAEAYPLDTLMQNVCILGYLFWDNTKNTESVSRGMDEIQKNSLSNLARSFRGSFSFLIYIDDNGKFQKIFFSKNIPQEFISSVHDVFKKSLSDILNTNPNQISKVFKNRKILLRLNLDWAFSNSQTLPEHIDDGFSSLDFDNGGSAFGEVLITSPNYMGKQI